jgi:hypothetical protein
MVWYDARITQTLTYLQSKAKKHCNTVYISEFVATVRPLGFQIIGGMVTDFKFNLVFIIWNCCIAYCMTLHLLL